MHMQGLLISFLLFNQTMQVFGGKKGKKLRAIKAENNKASTSSTSTNTNLDPFELYSNYFFLQLRGPEEEYGCVQEHTFNVYDPNQKKVYGKKNTKYILPSQKKTYHKTITTPVIDEFRIIKHIDLEKTDMKNFDQEASLLYQIQSPFVARLNHVFFDELFKTGHLALEFMAGDMEEFLKLNGQMTEKEAQFYAANLVMAVAQLQQHKIVKKAFMLRDIWVGHDGYLLLTDVNIAASNDQSNSLASLTGPYTAPEVQAQQHGATLSFRDFSTANLWSVGAFTYRLLTGKAPSKQLDFEDATVSEQAKHFVIKLLNPNPKKRLGKNDVRSVKDDAFFGKRFDWQNLSNKKLTPPMIPQFGKKIPRFERYINPKEAEELEDHSREED